MTLVPFPVASWDAAWGSDVAGSFGGALVVGALDGRMALHRSQFSGADFAFDQLDVTGSVELCAKPPAGILVCQAIDGRLHLRQQAGWVTLPADEPVLSAPGVSWEVRVTDARIRLTYIRSGVLARLADGLSLPIAQSPLDFRSCRVDPHLSDVWNRSVDYVTGMSHSEVSATEVMAETCGRVLGAAALLSFARTAAHQVPDDLDSSAPQRLRLAMSFVADNAREDVGIQDIADAVHLSTRAVQYLFRKHVDMTPTEYLKRVRLHGAHRDLVTCDPSVTNVRDVAATWRFGHTGRFAAAYRETFGNSPHFILRR